MLLRYYKVGNICVGNMYWKLVKTVLFSEADKKILYQKFERATDQWWLLSWATDKYYQLLSKFTSFWD